MPLLYACMAGKLSHNKASVRQALTTLFPVFCPRKIYQMLNDECLHIEAV